MKQLLKQLISFLLPITMTIIIPYLLIPKIKLPLLEKHTPIIIISLIVGSLCIVIGIYLLITTIRTFALIGKGTLAPWSPTQKLITGGIYAHVRNPMISGVLFILLGESLVCISWVLFIWFLTFFAVNNIYFSLSEEPGLIKRFGIEYQAYKKNVPRWIPRTKPWLPGNEENKL